MKRADFPNASPLQPLPPGVVSNISHNINSQSQANYVGPSSAGTVEILNPSVLNMPQTPTQPKNNYYLWAGGVMLVIFLLLVLGWVWFNRIKKNDIL